jgi:hypothetical protein
MNNDHRLEQLYHKGQDQIWDGREYLQNLLAKHIDRTIPDEQVLALRRILAVIYWGELAAWKISAALALRLDHHQARMAATSQAHDEARHFYVMGDYLEDLGEVPEKLDKQASIFLDSVLQADNTAKMLLGMQLMVEPLALTLFRIVREQEIDPVLSELLIMYERDEARHVALGTLYLPEVLREMNFAQKADLILWQFREYMRQFSMLRSLSDDFVTLGIEPRRVFAASRKKQANAMALLSKEMGEQYPFMGPMLRMIDFRAEIEFPEEADVVLYERLKKAFQVATKKEST